MRLFLLIFCLVLPSPCQSADQLKAALLLEHAQPSSWTRLLIQGFNTATAKYGVAGDVIIAPPDDKQREIFRKAAAEYDLVLVASDAFHDLLRDNAANFRRTKFGSIDAGIRAPNIMSVTFADEQAAFLAGAAAARMAGTPAVIGWLSGADTPAMRSLFSGYSEGAILERPGCRVIQAVVGSFTDPAVAVEKAHMLLNAGAKVIALAAGTGNEAALKAIKAAGGAVILLDVSDAGQEFGSIAKAVDKAVEEIIASAAGTFRGKEILIYNLANNGVNFVQGASFSRLAAPQTARRLKELRQEIINGGIRLHSLRQRTLCDCLD